MKETKALIKVISSQGIKKEIPAEDIINAQTTRSIEQYAGTFEISVKNIDGKNTQTCEPRDEIEVWFGNEKESEKVMGGFVDRIIFQKDQTSLPTIQLQGRDYSAVLLDTKISGRIHFAHGYSQILRELLKGTSLKTNGILETAGEGEIIFRDAYLIDIIRHLAENIGWTFRVDDDKVFHFKPISPPKDSGVVITDEEIISMKFEKR